MMFSLNDVRSSEPGSPERERHQVADVRLWYHGFRAAVMKAGCKSAEKVLKFE
jgi:hypothetical protein